MLSKRILRKQKRSIFVHIKILGLLLSDLPGERELLSDLGSQSVITSGMGSTMTAVWLIALSRT